MNVESFDELVRKLHALDFGDPNIVIKETRKWIEELPEEEKKTKIIGISKNGTIEITREQIPEMLEKDPKFLNFWIMALKEYHDFFLKEKRGENPQKKSRKNLLTLRLRLAEKIKILITDASDWGDKATWIGGAFYRELMQWAEDIGYNVIKLMHEEVVRDTWDATLVNNPDIVLISHCGHGNYTTVTGYKLSILAKVGEYNPELYKGKVASWLSCEMGKKLLEDMVNKGLTTGDGYEEVYYFYYKGVEPPNEDPYAKSFIGTHLNTTKMLLLGYYYREAFEETNKLYEQEAIKWREKGHPDIASTLLYDRRIHVLKGDPNWHLPILEEIPTQIGLDINYEVKEGKNDRTVIWKIAGVLSASDGALLDNVPIHITVGRVKKTAYTREDGYFETEITIKYPPDEIREEIKAEFNGCIINNKRYLPSQGEETVVIPFTKVHTTIIVKDAWYVKHSFFTYEYFIKTMLKDIKRMPLEGRVIIGSVAGPPLPCSDHCETNEEGECTLSIMCSMDWINALWTWLFGRKVKYKVEFTGDATHLPSEEEGYIKIKGIFF